MLKIGSMMALLLGVTFGITAISAIFQLSNFVMSGGIAMSSYFLLKDK
jgi:hypothetical protein